MKSTNLPADGTFLGRVRSPNVAHPIIVTVHDGTVVDITSKQGPTVSDVCEMDDPAAYVRSAAGKSIGTLGEITANSFDPTRDPPNPFVLSPVDLQTMKASGVTFVVSLLERVIEEQARGSSEKADAIRNDIVSLIGKDLSTLKPGSREAMDIKAKLISRGAWSQYLEVGIGPDAEIFTKCQPMSSVGFDADIGLHPISTWNNPEPEIAIIVSSNGRIVGATLGNDVNLRDVEGRSALLLGKAKDNNASASLGPFIRLFDASNGAAHADHCEYGHKPWQKGYKDEARDKRDTEALYRFHAEWAMKHGPKYTAFNHDFGSSGPREDSPEMMEHHKAQLKKYRAR